MINNYNVLMMLYPKDPNLYNNKGIKIKYLK